LDVTYMKKDPYK